MDFSTRGQDVKQGGGSKGFNAGVVQASVFDAVVKTASTGKKQLQLVLVGPTIPDFEGWDIDRNDASKGKHKGLSSVVSGTIYVDSTVFNNTDVNANPFLHKFVTIAKELGVKDEIDAISATSLEDWVKKAKDVVKGRPLYFFLAGAEEVYEGKTRVKLSLPKYKFAAADPVKLDTFDKTNKWHYKAVDVVASASTDEVSDFDSAPFDIN